MNKCTFLKVKTIVFIAYCLIILIYQCSITWEIVAWSSGQNVSPPTMRHHFEFDLLFGETLETDTLRLLRPCERNYFDEILKEASMAVLVWSQVRSKVYELTCTKLCALRNCHYNSFSSCRINMFNIHTYNREGIYNRDQLSHLADRRIFTCEACFIFKLNSCFSLRFPYDHWS